MSKLKGSRLEAEVDRVRADANWKRLTELLPSIKSKNSGLEDCYEMFQAEIVLETYLDQLGEIIRPSKDHVEKLSSAESLLQNALREKSTNQNVKIEANILLAKVLYACVEFRKALQCISNSEMENGKTPFRTLRALRLVAEGYAVKGLCIESMEDPTPRPHSNSASSISSTSSSSKDQKALYVFEKSAELAIFYINELEKSINSSQAKSTVSGSLATPTSQQTAQAGVKQQEKIGELLERVMERVAIIRAKDTAAKKQSSGTEGIEWYRKIITCLGDKYTGERLKQKLSRQFAELLIRATVPIEEKSMSEAMQTKAMNMKLYHGSHKTFFTPKSKIEEIILLLLINEVLSTREVILSRADDLSNSRTLSLQNAKSSFNLLTLVLSTINQYQLLAQIYERAMKFANNDSFLWQQFALSAICCGRFSRAIRVFEQSILASTIASEASESSKSPASSTDSTPRNHRPTSPEMFSSLKLTNNPSCALSVITEYMMISQVLIERFGNYEPAIEYASKAVELCSKEGQLSFLKGRCQLLHAIAYGFRASEEPSWETKKAQLAKTVHLIEECVSIDPHDYLALYYAAYFHAISRDLESAKDRCSRSLALNGDQPGAIMLLALIFTAYGDLKGALELVINALSEFEHNYGLMVLRLHIETKFGRIEESLDTCTHLLDFWKKQPIQQQLAYSAGILDEERSQRTLNGTDLIGSSQKTGTPSLGRELSTPLVTTPLIPSFPATGIPVISAIPGNTSTVDLSIAESIVGTAASEAGAAPSTASDSLNNGIGDAWSKFRTQADVWMCLAELYIAEGRHADLTKVIEQAITMFPSSPQALYLKQEGGASGRRRGFRKEAESGVSEGDGA
uniref:TTC7_N domain-containing protein n=1 Tax=Caenorhabditis tropicalis TaxID=1561998 RepID=A0A1I7UWZ9_9PELO